MRLLIAVLIYTFVFSLQAPPSFFENAAKHDHDANVHSHDEHSSSILEAIKFVFTGKLQHSHDHTDEDTTESHSHSHQHTLIKALASADFLAVGFQLKVVSATKAWDGEPKALHPKAFQSEILRPPILTS